MTSEEVAQSAKSGFDAAWAIHRHGTHGAVDHYNDLFATALSAGDPYSYLAALNRTLSILERYEAATTQQQGENSNGNNS